MKCLRCLSSITCNGCFSPASSKKYFNADRYLVSCAGLIPMSVVELSQARMLFTVGRKESMFLEVQKCVQFLKEDV